jgi:hypothetical protein
MSDFNSIKAQLQKLIDDANAKTEKADVDLTSAVGTLIEGYGAGEALQDAEEVEF